MRRFYRGRREATARDAGATLHGEPALAPETRVQMSIEASGVRERFGIEDS